MFGYQLFDKVSLPGNKVGFIYGRRISGCFDIRDIFGNRIKEITYRKIKLIKATPRQFKKCFGVALFLLDYVYCIDNRHKNAYNNDRKN